MIIQMYEKTHMAYRLFLYSSPFVILIGLIAVLGSFKSNKILALLYLLLIVITSIAVVMVYTQSKAAKEVTLRFTQGYLLFKHPDYEIVFPPSAIESVTTKREGKYMRLLMVVEPKKVQVRGRELQSYVLNVKMTNEEYENKFRVMYEGRGTQSGDTSFNMGNVSGGVGTVNQNTNMQPQLNAMGSNQQPQVPMQTQALTKEQQKALKQQQREQLKMQRAYEREQKRMSKLQGSQTNMMYNGQIPNNQNGLQNNGGFVPDQNNNVNGQSQQPMPNPFNK